MKPDYSIKELADLRNDSVHVTVGSLMAYGVPAYYQGKEFNLSRLVRSPYVHQDGNSIYVILPRNGYTPPDPSEVIVLCDSLPTAWVRCILDGISDENNIVSTTTLADPLSATSPIPPISFTQPETQAVIPRIGWQIALFEAWPEICKAYSRIPTARDASNWLKKHDASGYILNKGVGSSLWWSPQRGEPKEVPMKTIENVISKWRVNGVLPA